MVIFYYCSNLRVHLFYASYSTYAILSTISETLNLHRELTIQQAGVLSEPINNPFTQSYPYNDKKMIISTRPCPMPTFNFGSVHRALDNYNGDIMMSYPSPLLPTNPKSQSPKTVSHINRYRNIILICHLFPLCSDSYCSPSLWHSPLSYSMQI